MKSMNALLSLFLLLRATLVASGMSMCHKNSGAGY
jgi:hypothetical protein